DLGDGTYAVDMKTDAGDCFVRVDADLAVWGAGGTSLRYAQQGHQGSIWAPIMEKAWAYFRRSQDTYASIEWGWPAQPLKAFGGSSNIQHTADTSALAYLNFVAGELAAGKAVTAGTIGTITDGSPVIGSTGTPVDQ